MENNINKIKDLEIINALGLVVERDGNKFLYIHEENVTTGISGVGDTASEAAKDFCRNYYNERIVIVPRKNVPEFTRIDYDDVFGSGIIAFNEGRPLIDNPLAGARTHANDSLRWVRGWEHAKSKLIADLINYK